MSVQRALYVQSACTLVVHHQQQHHQPAAPVASARPVAPRQYRTKSLTVPTVSTTVFLALKVNPLKYRDYVPETLCCIRSVPDIEASIWTRTVLFYAGLWSKGRYIGHILPAGRKALTQRFKGDGG